MRRPPFRSTRHLHCRTLLPRPSDISKMPTFLLIVPPLSQQAACCFCFCHFHCWCCCRHCFRAIAMGMKWHHYSSCAIAIVIAVAIAVVIAIMVSIVVAIIVVASSGRTLAFLGCTWHQPGSFLTDSSWSVAKITGGTTVLVLVVKLLDKGDQVLVLQTLIPSFSDRTYPLLVGSSPVSPSSEALNLNPSQCFLAVASLSCCSELECLVYWHRCGLVLHSSLWHPLPPQCISCAPLLPLYEHWQLILCGHHPL